MAKSSSIMFIATQFGSFNVVYPVLDACSRKYNIGYMGIKDIETDNLIRKKIVADNDLIDYDCLDKFDMFITGTSPSSDIDYKVWEYAREKRRKSMCILDMSKDYERRFRKNNRYLFPDIICVMNDRDRDIFCGVATSKSRIVVTGSPYLSDIRKFCITRDEKNIIKRKMSANNKKIITFCTEYILKKNEKEEYGYDELSILSDILCYIENRGRDNFKLFIRLHPEDSASIYENFLKMTSRKIDCELIISDPGYKVLQISDVVIGMTSTILAESSILGLNIVSYQPVNDKSKIYEKSAAIRKNLVTSKDELAKKIDIIFDLKKKNICNFKSTPNNAVKKIMALIEEGLSIQNEK